MLTPNQWEEVGDQAIKIYDELELEIIQEIAERIANFEFANSVVLNNIKIAQEMGLLYEDIIIRVAKYNNLSIDKVKEIFEKTGVKSLSFDDKIYRMEGLNPLHIRQNEAMWKFLEATALKTNLNLNNLVLTTADVVQTDFYNQMNKAYMEVSTGVKSYSQAIQESVKVLSQKGARVKYPSGQTRSIESAVRMNVLTSVNQTCGRLQEMRANELKWDLMETTAHSGARPSHAEWQGGIVSLSGREGYLSKEDIGYGKADGFKGPNCKHDWFPYSEGSTRSYTQKELDRLKNEKVTYNGKQISKYEATQIQRKIERQIRDDKKELSGIQGILNSDNKDNKFIEDMKTDFARKSLIYSEHKNKLDNFLYQTGLNKDTSRIFVPIKNSVYSKVSSVNKIANKYNNSNIIGTVVNGTKITEIGEHIISRAYARNIKVEDVEDTLKNPIKFGKIRTDFSQQIKGKTCTIAINVKTGKLITVFPKKTEE